MSEIQLPDKPSELIRLALFDLRKCEQDPRFKINMAVFHKPEDGVCHICLAGAVMAQSSGIPISEHHLPDDDAVGDKYLALDAFRDGMVSLGLHRMGIDASEVDENVTVKGYHDNPAQFHLDMESLAALLEKHGL